MKLNKKILKALQERCLLDWQWFPGTGFPDFRPAGFRLVAFRFYRDRGGCTFKKVYFGVRQARVVIIDDLLGAIGARIEFHSLPWAIFQRDEFKREAEAVQMDGSRYRMMTRKMNEI